MPWCVALTHEDIDHVAENQLFPDAEIIAHRTMPVRMKQAADPAESQKLTNAVRNVISRGCSSRHQRRAGLPRVSRQADGRARALGPTEDLRRHVSPREGERHAVGVLTRLPGRHVDVLGRTQGSGTARRRGGRLNLTRYE
jgi:hypothetical protein